MLSTYNRKKLSVIFTGEECHVYYRSNRVEGLEWNQYIGRVIINDFIKQMDDHEGTDFSEYMGVLPYIEYGLFQSAIKIISQIEIPGLEKVKEWLLRSLAEGEDRYEKQGADDAGNE